MLSSGQQLNTRDCAVSFVLRGTIDVCQVDDSKERSIVLKQVHSPRMLSPVLSISWSLLGVYHPCHSDANPGYGTFIVERFSFVASSHSRIATLSTRYFTDWLALHPAAALQIVDNILRRFYFATIPFAQMYLGLGQDILDLEMKASVVERSRKPSWADFAKFMATLHRMNFRDLFIPASAPVDQTGGFESNNSDILLSSNSSSTFTLKKASSLPRPGTRQIPNSPHSSAKKLRIHVPSTSQIFSNSDFINDLPSALTQLEHNMSRSGQRNLPDVEPIIKSLIADLLYEVCGLHMEGGMRPTTIISRDEFEEKVELSCYHKGSIIAKKGQRMPGLYMLLDRSVGISESGEEGFQPVIQVSFTHPLPLCDLHSSRVI